MISYKEIKKSINNKLISHFNLEVQSNDVKEGFKRPSFFVKFDDVKRSNYVSQSEKAFTVRIYYFPESMTDFSLELLETQEQLEELFDLKLKVLDRYLNIDETDTEEVDGVLEFTFSLDFYEGKAEKEYLADPKGETVLDVEGKPISIEKMREIDWKG